MSTFAIVLVPLLWLPGYLALRLSDVPQGLRERWTSTEKLFAEVALSVVLLLWISVTLALLGLFFPWTVAGCAVLVALLLAALVRRRSRSLLRAPSYRTDGALIVVIGLAVAGALLYSPPFEHIVGGRDPVTYMVSGINLAREGSWVSYDDEVTTIVQQHRNAFLGPDHRENLLHWGPRLVGWYLMDPDTGRVVPQGLPLYPAAIALGYLAAGIDGAVHTTIVLAIAAAVALFFLGRRWLNPAVGLAAAIMLVVSPTQVWFSRYANAETLAQLLVLFGLYGFLVYRSYGGWAFGLLAGAAFGLSLLAQVWMVWLALPLGALLLFDLLRGRIDRGALLAFWLPLIALGVQASVVYVTVTTAYMRGVYNVFRWSLWTVVPLIVVAVALLAGIAYWGRRARSPRAEAERRQPKTLAVEWARVGTAGLLVAAAAWAYWVRPVTINAWSADAVPRLVLAVTLAVFGFAVAGVVVLLVDRRRAEASTWVLAIALGVIVPPLWEPGISPHLMWSLRRYQAFLPLVFLFAAVPLWINDAGGARRTVSRPIWMRPIATLVSVFLVLPLALQGWQYRGFKEPGDSIALVDSIAASIEPDAVLIFEARSGWGALDLAPGLAYWKGFDVLWLQDKPTDGEALRDFVRRQSQRGRQVYFFTQGFNYYFAEPRMVPHRRWWFKRQQLEESYAQMPERVESSLMPLSVYRAEPDGRNGPLDGALDVGNWDDIYVGEALPWEVSGPFTARWTRGVGQALPSGVDQALGYFWLPGLDENAGEIVVHADTIAGSAGIDRTLTATLDGVVLGELPIAQGWTDYVFDVPSGWRPTPGEAPRLELRTQALRPDAINGEGDTRSLGVLVNAILWR